MASKKFQKDYQKPQVILNSSASQPPLTKSSKRPLNFSKKGNLLLNESEAESQREKVENSLQTKTNNSRKIQRKRKNSKKANINKCFNDKEGEDTQIKSELKDETNIDK